MIVIKNASLRRIISRVVPYIAIPLIVAVGIFVFEEKRWAMVALGVAVCTVLLFLAGFDSGKTGSRRLILSAVLSALSVAGRFIPIFKPVTAITMIAGMWLGGEAGFLVGSMSALVSNIYFGHGPWTPFQMFAWGMIGLFSGYLSVPLRKSRIFLLIAGALAGGLYSMIMDIWTIMWYNGSMDLSLYAAAMVTALPHTIIYVLSNVIFLFILAGPIGEKLSRVKIKYGV
ncbi:MAG: ECF transporter S component [Clostridia bacterium]|nr:ECF transporter S component [Clostridia bacterium]